jgi:methenyltetrahydromethanopterin cyclohydrolase
LTRAGALDRIDVLLSNVTDSVVGAAQVQYLTIDASVYRVVTVPFDVQIYEEITITP